MIKTEIAASLMLLPPEAGKRNDGEFEVATLSARLPAGRHGNDQSVGRPDKPVV